MQKYIRTLLVFLLVLLLTAGLLLLLSRTVPVLPAGSALPDDLEERLYLLTDAQPDAATGGMRFAFSGGEQYEALALGIPSSNRFFVQVNGETIYENTGEERYTRAHAIEFPSGESMELLYAEGSAGGALSLLSVTNPQILLGTPQSLAATMDAANFVNAMMMGMYAMLCFCCLAMFIGKRSERYLLYLSVGTAVILLTLACTAGVLRLSYGTFRTLRPILYTLPVAMSVYVSLNLFKEQLPPFLRRFASPPVLLLELGLAMVLQLGAPTIQYYVVRFLLWIPMLAALPVSGLKKDWRVLLILAAFAVAEGLSLFPYALPGVPRPACFMFVRLSDVGNLLFVAACMVVIVERFCAKFKEAESLSTQLAQVNAGLEAIVAQRTQELKDKQAHKHGLMINIFHDLRSPLFAIRGRLDTFVPENDAQREFLSVTNSRLAYVERLIEDLFLLAKLESNDLLFDETEVDMNELLETVCAAAQQAAGAKGISLVRETGGDCFVWGDGYRLQQAVSNLIDNAVLYTPAGGRICVSLAPGGPIVLTVQDNGNGIPPDKLEHIFERYYVVETRGNRRSSGLGLAIAHELIAAHGGTLSAESTLGEGTRFTVTLPPV